MTIQTKTWMQDKHVLAEQFGIHLDNVMDYTTHARVGDSAVTPITAVNNAIPGQYTTYLDPQIIETIISPPKAAEIYGEAKKGDWLHDTIMFTTIEPAGDIAAYGDYNNSGMSRTNTNFPQRQQFLVQTLAQWGDREQARSGLANIDIASAKRRAAVLDLNYWQNQSYFFGVANLQNYGALNDPNLPPAITPDAKTAGGVTWEKATATEVYNDIRKLYRQLQVQSKGVINLDNAVNYESPLKLVMPTEIQDNLLKTNEFGISVTDLLKKNFPNLKQVSAPQLSGASGHLMQLFIENYQGVDTFTCAFSEKCRSHGIVRESSSYKEKLSQGSWGTILARPVLVAQMIGM